MEEYKERYDKMKGREEMPIIEHRDDTFQCDTMFYPLRGKMRAVFCAVEMTSRVGYIRAYSGATPTGKQCVELLKEMVETVGVKHLSCDPGTEFTNKEVKAFREEKGIDIYFIQTGETKEKA